MIDLLIQAAKAEKWNLINKIIPEECNKKEVIAWATTKGIEDKDGNVRDLAVSILEKTKTLDKATKAKLLSLMKNDSNDFVRYRSAFALAGHDPAYRKTEVLRILKEAAKNDEIKGIAQRYLHNISETGHF